MILIVEDNKDLCDLFAEVIRQDGFRVIQANTSEEATALAEANHLRLVLLDYNIGGAGSSAFLGALRAPRLSEGVPLVLVSGSSDIEALAARVNALAFVSKPVDPETLLGVVRRYART